MVRAKVKPAPTSPPGCGQQQLLHLLLPEFRHCRRAVAARLLAGRYQVKAAILHALQLAIHDFGFRRIALVIGGINSQ